MTSDGHLHKVVLLCSWVLFFYGTFIVTTRSFSLYTQTVNSSLILIKHCCKCLIVTLWICGLLLLFPSNLPFKSFLKATRFKNRTSLFLVSITDFSLVQCFNIFDSYWHFLYQLIIIVIYKYRIPLHDT